MIVYTQLYCVLISLGDLLRIRYAHICGAHWKKLVDFLELLNNVMFEKQFYHHVQAVV